MEYFTGKNILITGGNSGIGKSCALEFAKKGANIFLIDKNEIDVSFLNNEVKTKNIIIEAFTADVSEEDQMQSVMKTIEQKYNYIDGAANCAGILVEDSNIHESDYAEWKKVMQINAGGVYLSLKYEIPLLMKAEKPAVVNVSSVSGLLGKHTATSYVASKHAVLGLTNQRRINMLNVLELMLFVQAPLTLPCCMMLLEIMLIQLFL